MTIRILQLACLLPLFAGGCDQLECGGGTARLGDTCQPADVTEPACGPGTTYDSTTGLCTNSLVESGFGECGEGTERVVLDDGIAVCVGTGAVDCNSEPPCPAPNPGRVTVCGRIHDLATLEPVGTNETPLQAGVLQAEIWEPLSFVQGTPLRLGQAELNCGGWFTARDLFPQASQLLAIGVDDGDGAPDSNIQTGVAFSATAGETVRRLTAFITPRTLDAQWTSSAGDPFAGATFAERGVFLPIYIDPTADATPPFRGAPVAGVTVTRDGSVVSGSDYYFASGAGGYETVDPTLNATSSAGGALFVNAPTAENFSGVGAEPAGCGWSSELAGTAAGIVFVQVKEALCP